MLVTRTSVFSGITRTIELDITEEQLKNIENSAYLIQQVVPHLSDDEREFLLSGAWDNEWEDAMIDYGEEDYYDDEDAF